MAQYAAPPKITVNLPVAFSIYTLVDKSAVSTKTPAPAPPPEKWQALHKPLTPTDQPHLPDHFGHKQTNSPNQPAQWDQASDTGQSRDRNTAAGCNATLSQHHSTARENGSYWLAVKSRLFIYRFLKRWGCVSASFSMPR